MLLSTSILLLTASFAFAERNTLCDDGGPLTCSVKMPDTLSDYRCGTHGLWAVQTGCYVCVDATTCAVIDSTLAFDEAQKNSLTLPKANGNDISILLEDQADHSPEDPVYEQAAITNVASTQTEESAKSADVSNWLFSIPVCLAIVSLGLAIRARIPQRRRGFQRLQDRNRQHQDVNPLFQEDINPFCSNEREEDIVIETAGHFQGEPSNSESEETEFLPSEEDAFTLAESEAIKQAVLLHIKEFDEQEDEAEI
ncbi:hypothetical protein L914_00344 [Phytophthora nicotianae]|uniref:Uncharacterized protein n=2 Tax=Phytophthora nicotianae TaxID=4792 RepID=V9G0Q0_PHYNI|nr:hypothetical protein F443_00386 [Phytophthora nicotianae P1569]ETM56732.1 hypothetical protein L914_00344 [Phytophthora nicotianae]